MSNANLSEQAHAVYARIQALRNESDGCTASPDFNFTECCVAHDIAYRSGSGSRATADKELRRCIKQKGYFLLPWVYWLGVRLFGYNAWRGVK